MEWKNVCAVLMITIVVIGFGMETYKKNIRGDGTGKTKAGKKEIVLVAMLLSLVFSLSFGIGFGFPGLPWTLPGYALGVFLLQWFIDQTMVKKAWKALGLVEKSFLRKQGVPDKDLEVLDE
jgi:hypothetical protein